MNQKHLKRTARLSLIMTFLALLSLVTATYAWFSNIGNQAVKTTKVDATTGEEDFKLYLSKSTDFSGKLTELDLTSKIKTPLDELQLLPVSTADLTNFVWANATATASGTQASAFHRVTGEEAEGKDRLYHGQVYIEAVGTNLDENVKAGIYLNGTDEKSTANPLSDSSDGFTNAVRIGLKFTPADGGTAQTAILRMTEKINTSGNAIDTVVNGATISADNVLSSDSSGNVSAVADPSKYYTDYVITSTNVPATLASLDINKAYLLDVYVYIEGCDPDCNETLAGESTGTISLKFFSSPA